MSVYKIEQKLRNTLIKITLEIYNYLKFKFITRLIVILNGNTTKYKQYT